MNDSFNFRLQRVLDYREYIKMQKAEKLAEYGAQLDREKNTLNSLLEQKTVIANEMGSKCSKGVQAGYLIQCNMYIDQLKTFIDRSIDSVSNMEKKVKEGREDLVEASRKKEVMDRLKSRHYTRFSSHLAKEQEKEVEDLVNNRKVNI